MEANSKNPIDMLIIVAVVLLAGVAGTWFFVGGEDEELVSAPSLDPAPGVAQQAAEIAEAQDNQALLALARLAMAAGQLLQPEGSSALDYFERVLANEPGNAAALDGIERVLDAVALSSETALAAGNVSAALGAYESLQRAAPTSTQTFTVQQLLIARQTELTERAGRLIENERFDDAAAMLDQAAEFSTTEPELLSATRTSLEEAREAAKTVEEAPVLAAVAEPSPAKPAKAAPKNTAPAKAAPKPVAQPAPPETDPTDELFVSALARLANGKLVEPRSDSAYFYYEEIASLAPDHADLVTFRNDLADAMLEKASAAFSAGNIADTEKWLAYVTGIDPDNPTLASVQTQLVRRQIDTESKRVIPMEELELVKFVEPRYPTRAAREQVSGWADVQFTVSEDGKPKEIEVVEVSEKGYFESATRQAVSKWRFKPREYQGQVIQQRVGVRVSFSFDS
ncbi:MAG: TonB family protein [Chromatiales bacterium]|jgi:TonB family protein